MTKRIFKVIEFLYINNNMFVINPKPLQRVNTLTKKNFVVCVCVCVCVCVR